MRGRQPYRQLELHEKYGSIVRVAPNEVSFSSARSWLEIYGPRKGIGTFIKSEFYDGGNFAAEALSIVSERDPKKHAEMRKYLASAFSDRSLKAQEPLIAHSVDLFVKKLGEAGQGNRGTNMVMWYNLMTFDIIGSLAFGQDFGGVESGTEHFWVAIVSKSLRLGALADFFRRFPMLSTIVQTVFSSFIDKLMVENRKHQQYTMDLVQRYARGWKKGAMVITTTSADSVPDVSQHIRIDTTFSPKSSKHARRLTFPKPKLPLTLPISCM